MRLRHSLPAVALGAVALGAALGADPARADSTPPLPVPLPTGPHPATAATSPNVIEALLPDVVESPLPIPLPLPSATPLPLPSATPLPLRSAIPLPSTSAKLPAAIPTRRPSVPSSSSPPAAPVPSASASRAASPPPPSAPPAPPPSWTATVSRGTPHGSVDGRARDRARTAGHTQVAMTAVPVPTPRPPARPEPGLPAFVLAVASAPTGVGAGGVDSPTSAAECPPSISPLSRGLTVAAVDMRATSRPVERGPPPPRQLLISQPRPRR
ncbi:hypothetical protein HNR22_001551 [Micromonospora jinlongensis]|uniref:Uncharacterized protein n=1 Tax=Micromonospora jinlongensis TaxID=1287877 RepID=A0A7Y9WYH4_9ACTN|nr:hypothetical protein [Micromonospora jinlongensis]